MANLQLEIVTPARKVLSQPVDEVRLAGVDGGFGVKPGHTPFVAQLKAGALVLVNGAQQDVFAMGEGFAQVAGDVVLVLAESADRAAELDVAAVKAELEAARKQLATLTAGAPGHAFHASMVARLSAKLAVAEKRPA